MRVEPFVDTNIWIYAHLDQGGDSKGRMASALVESGRRFVIITQILNEYYAAMLRNRMDDSWIQTNVEAMIQRCDVRLITLAVIRQAHARYQDAIRVFVLGQLDNRQRLGSR